MDKPKFYCADVYNTVYAFHKKWSGVEDTDENWRMIVADAESVMQERGTGIAKDLIMSALNELERRICDKKDKQEDTKDYYIWLLKHQFNVKTDEELAKAIMGRGTG